MIAQSHWVIVAVEQFTRQVIGFSVHAGPVDGSALRRLFNSILGALTSPRYSSTDNHPLFKLHRWKANLRILDVEEVQTGPAVPLSHPFVQRLIGTLRRAFFDHVPFWGALDMERKSYSFKTYYNQDRVHRGLERAVSDPTRPSSPSGAKRITVSRARSSVNLPTSIFQRIQHPCELN